jgi:hypothetical protein
MDGRSVASSSTTASKQSKQRRERISWNVQKLLAQDIETHGGIEHFSSEGNKGEQRFSRLLNQRDPQHPSAPPNPYGARGETFRKKLRRKLDYWIELHEKGRYITDILDPWLIDKSPMTTRRNTRTTGRNSRAAAAARISEDVSVDSSVSGESNNNNLASPPQVIVSKKVKGTPILDKFQNMTLSDKKRNKNGSGIQHLDLTGICKLLECGTSENKHPILSFSSLFCK